MPIVHDAHFYRALDSLELQLQECTNIIKGVFDEYGTDPDDLSEDEMDEDDFIFTEILYFYKFIVPILMYLELLITNYFGLNFATDCFFMLIPLSIVLFQFVLYCNPREKKYYIMVLS